MSNQLFNSSPDFFSNPDFNYNKFIALALWYLGAGVYILNAPTLVNLMSESYFEDYSSIIKPSLIFIGNAISVLGILYLAYSYKKFRVFLTNKDRYAKIAIFLILAPVAAFIQILLYSTVGAIFIFLSVLVPSFIASLVLCSLSIKYFRIAKKQKNAENLILTTQINV
jgi:hypothetical protein